MAIGSFQRAQTSFIQPRDHSVRDSLPVRFQHKVVRHLGENHCLGLVRPLCCLHASSARYRV
jgi:hypothetical protein